MGGKASVNKVADTRMRTMRSHGSDKHLAVTPSPQATPTVAPSPPPPSADAVLDERGGYKMCMAPDSRLYWINKTGERFDDEPACWKPVKRHSILQVTPTPQAVPAFEASIPGTVEEPRERSSDGDDADKHESSELRQTGTVDLVVGSPANPKLTEGGSDVPARQVPLTKEASIASILHTAIGADAHVARIQKNPSKSLHKEVSIANILKDALEDATVVVPRSSPARPSAPSLTKEASIANALGNDASRDAPLAHRRPSKALAKEASIANILKTAMGDDATVVTAQEHRRPPKELTKEASIANMLRDAVGDSATASPSPTLSKEASIANILKGVLAGSDVTNAPSTMASPNSKAALLRDFEIGAAVTILNTQPDDTPQPSKGTDIEVPLLGKMPSTRSTRSIHQGDGQGSLTLSRGLNTSPSKAVLVPSESRAELDRLLSEGGDAFATPSSAAPLDGMACSSMPHNASLDVAPSIEVSAPTSPGRARGKRATFHQGSTPLRLPVSIPQQPPIELAQPQPSVEGSPPSRQSRMSIPGGERGQDRKGRDGEHGRHSSLPTDESGGNARADLNRLVLDTQRAVATHSDESGRSDATPNSMPKPIPRKPIPVRNTRASFTRGSHEQAASILQTTARLQTSSRTSFRQARLSNADVESLIMASRGGGLAQSSSQVNELMLAEQEAARQALDAAKKPLSVNVSERAADSSSDGSVVGLMRLSPSKANLMSAGQALDGQDPPNLHATPSRSRLDAPVMLQHSPSRSFRQLRVAEAGRDMLQRSATGLRSMNTSPSKAVLVPSQSRAELNRLLLADQHVDASANGNENGGIVGLMRTSPSKAVLVPSESRAELNRLLLADQHNASTSDDNTGCIGLMRTSPSKAVLVPSESRAELNRLLLADQHNAATTNNTGCIGLMRTSPSKAVLVPSDSRADVNRLHLVDHQSSAPGAGGVMSSASSKGNLRAPEVRMLHSPSRSFRQMRSQDPERELIQRSNTGLRGMLSSPSKAGLGPASSRAELKQVLVDAKLAGAVASEAENFSPPTPSPLPDLFGVLSLASELASVSPAELDTPEPSEQAASQLRPSDESMSHPATTSPIDANVAPSSEDHGSSGAATDSPSESCTESNGLKLEEDDPFSSDESNARRRSSPPSTSIPQLMLDDIPAAPDAMLHSPDDTCLAGEDLSPTVAECPRINGERVFLETIDSSGSIETRSRSSSATSSDEASTQLRATIANGLVMFPTSMSRQSSRSGVVTPSRSLANLDVTKPRAPHSD